MIRAFSHLFSHCSPSASQRAHKIEAKVTNPSYVVALMSHQNVFKNVQDQRRHSEAIYYVVIRRIHALT